MTGVNKVILVGRAGRDPEINSTQGGTIIANLTLATSVSWKDKETGERQEKTEWHRIVAFGRLVEIIEEYVRKGDLIYIEGQLQTRSWEKDGQKHFSTEIKAGIMQMLGSRPEQSEARPRQQPARTEQAANPEPIPEREPRVNFDENQDIPF